MIAATYVGMSIWPTFLENTLLPKIEEWGGVKKEENGHGHDAGHGGKPSLRDQALVAIMFVSLLIFGTITYFAGTHLWGCFIAGMAFAMSPDPNGPPGAIVKNHHAHHCWERQTKRITKWLLRFFFACTVAFSIPVNELLSLKAFLFGSILGIGPCLCGKILCAPWLEARFVIGWAMVGRAEFAYLIAQMAAAGNMMDAETFSYCIWALLWATITAPFAFSKLLQMKVQADLLKKGKSGQGDDGDAPHEIKVGHEESASAPLNRKVDERPIEIQDVDIAAGLNIDEKNTTVVKKVSNAHDKDIEHGGDCATAGMHPLTIGHGTSDSYPLKHGNYHRNATGGGGFLCCLFFKRISIQD